jgi:hypothetical protein
MTNRKIRVLLVLQFAFIVGLSLPEQTQFNVLGKTTHLQATTNTPASRQAIQREITAHLEQENFAALDAMALQFRLSKERLTDGEWKLYVFYQALARPPQGEAATDTEWEIHLGKFKKWSKQVATSITPRVAWGWALTEYAWRARVQGQDWHGIAEDAGGKLFQQRLLQAEKVLNDTGKATTKCPHWYLVMLKVGLGQLWDRSKYDNIYSAGIALEPRYTYLYLAKAYHLLPRNRGGQDEWVKYTGDVYSRLGDKEGALTYYLITSHLRTEYGEKLLQQNQLSWLKLREGFKALEETYGVTNTRMNEMAWMAWLAKDQGTAQSLFIRLGTNWDDTIWKYKVTFEQARAWGLALAAPGMPTNAPAPMAKTIRLPPTPSDNIYPGLIADLRSPSSNYGSNTSITLEAVITNSSLQDQIVNTYELTHPGTSLIIEDNRMRRLPLPKLQPIAPKLAARFRQTIKAGQSLRLTIRFLDLKEEWADGEYKVRMAGMYSNQVSFRLQKMGGRF